MRAAEEDAAASPFARLPDALVALVLSHLSDVASIGRALTVSRGFAAAGTADARLVWARAAAALQWRLRRRESETGRELCVRANARRQRIAVFGGSCTVGSPLYTHDMYDVARQEWLPSPFLFTTYPRDASALASDGATVALLGGWGGTRAVRAVEAASLTEEARSWKRLTPLPRRLCFGAAQMDASGRLWFAGGGVESSAAAGSLPCPRPHTHAGVLAAYRLLNLPGRALPRRGAAPRRRGVARGGRARVAAVWPRRRRRRALLLLLRTRRVCRRHALPLHRRGLRHGDRQEHADPEHGGCALWPGRRRRARRSPVRRGRLVGRLCLTEIGADDAAARARCECCA